MKTKKPKEPKAPGSAINCVSCKAIGQTDPSKCEHDEDDCILEEGEARAIRGTKTERFQKPRAPRKNYTGPVRS